MPRQAQRPTSSIVFFFVQNEFRHFSRRSQKAMDTPILSPRFPPPFLQLERFFLQIPATRFAVFVHRAVYPRMNVRPFQALVFLSLGSGGRSNTTIAG
jgi:hypothetical protein